MTLTTTPLRSTRDDRPLPPLPPDRLLAIVRGLGRDAATWRALAHHDRDERWHLRLSSNARFDIWLIGWHAHQGIELHDHGGSAGAFTVVEGELLETAGVADDDPTLQETSLTVGSARAFGPGHVHWVVNPTDQVATSVHVYSPPLVTMDYFELTSDRSFTRIGTADADGPRSDAGEIRAGAAASVRAPRLRP
jgi:predicted metal-dependent enzyme (double-stranded beta helix superfamily)